MLTPLILPALLLLSLTDEPRFEVSAHIEDALLEAGATSTLVVEIDVEGTIHASFDSMRGTPEGLLRKPVLQLELPAGVELLDPAKPEAERKSRQDWLDFYFDRPFGRMVPTKRTEIPFRVSGDLEPGAEIGINVTTYLGDEDSRDAVFVRRRLQLPLAAGAVARAVEPDRSAWGRDRTLAIGQPAVDFSLPDGKGAELTLGEWLGRKRPVFAFTYRSSW